MGADSLSSDSLSFGFQFIMFFVGTIFWLLDCIPILNIFTNAIYWVIWVVVFIYKYKPLIEKVARSGVAIGGIYAKIGIISGLAFILGEIPIVSIIPWDLIASVWVNQLTKQLLARIKEITKDVEDLKKGWQSHMQQFPGNRRAAQTGNEADQNGPEPNEEGAKPNVVNSRPTDVAGAEEREARKDRLTA